MGIKNFGEAEFTVRCKDNKVSLIIHKTEVVAETKQDVYMELFDMVKNMIEKVE